MTAPLTVGRERELASLDALVARAQRGAGGALLLEGEAGIGKSALIDQMSSRFEGMRTLAAGGARAEAHLPFAALGSLLAPLIGELDGLPPVQARALRTALALGDEDTPAADPVATLQAITALVCDGQPTLVLVDDLHWVDPPTHDIVCFLARRVAGQRVALVAARRPDGSPAPADMERLEVSQLDRSDSKRLLDQAGLADSVAEQIAVAAGGNPLALTEIPNELTPEQRDGRVPIGRPLPAGPGLSAVYEERLAALPPDTRRALLVVSVAERGDRGALAAALEEVGAGLGALGPAEDSGLVTVSPAAIRFTHPLARSATYHQALATERRAAHLALAAHAPQEAAVWHRAAAAEGPDPEVAEALSAIAGRSMERGAPAAAAAALERAAEVAPDGDARFGFSLGAAYSALVGGQVDRARRLLDALLTTVAEPLARADVQRLRAGAIMLAGHPMESHDLLLSEVARIGDRDPGRTAALLVDAGVAQMASGNMHGLGELAERAAAASAQAGDPDALLPNVMLAEALAVQGEHERARAIVTGLELPAEQASTANTEVLAIAGLCLLWLEEYDEAESWVDRLIAAAREAGQLRALPMPLGVRACLDIRRGNLARAEAHAREAVAIAEVSAAGFVLAMALSTLATVLAWTGEPDECRAAAERALAIDRDLELGGVRAYTELALATLALAQGDSTTAVDHALRGLESSRDYGTRDPSFLQDGPNLVEALAREGREAEAHEALASLEEGADLTGGWWARAAVERCRGLQAPEEDVDSVFQEALRLHDQGAAMPLERARTLLCYGERLRRARRRADAREPLSAAKRAFERAGATGWVARAQRELEATGIRGRPQANGHAETLTGRELEICRLVSDGSQNQEVAAALFVSVRTVEYHLSNAYRKLGVRSRTELVGALTGE